MKFEIVRDGVGEFRFRLVSRNHKTIAISEGYKTKAMCKTGIAAVKKCRTAKIVDLAE